MTIPPNKLVGHYKILSSLGKGGMGEVLLARDTKLDRYVAIKFLNPDLSSDPDKLGRFMQEAKAASALNHPNILTVYEIGNDDGSHYIVTEYIDGMVVSDYIRKEEPGLQHLLEIAIQIVSALSAAHQAGIVHRDIKPGNIMIRSDRITKILDFGLAKLTNHGILDDSDPEAETLARVETLPGMLMGTPAYMSPEQARAQVLDERTDIFSFGVVFYEMIAGERVFEGESLADVIGAVLKDEPKSLLSRREDIPAELDSIVLKTLRKDRETRYQNSKDLLIDLKDLFETVKFEKKLTHATDSGLSPGIHGTQANEARETIIAQTEKSGAANWLKFFAFSLVPLIIAGAVYFSFFRETEQNPLNNVAANIKIVDAVSWNSAPGELFSIGRFSPDSKMIAFASTRPGSKDIWIKQTVEGSAVQITKDSFSNKDPIWSPTGDEIAYFSDRGNNAADQKNVTGVWRIPSLGGTPKSVGAIEDGSSQLRHWSAKGLIYYESDHNLYAMNLANGESKPVTNLDKENAGANWFAVSRDEKQIAFATKNEKLYEVRTIPIEGGDSRVIAQIDNEIGGLVWHPNGDILLSTAVDETFQIISISSTDGSQTRITSGDRNSLVVDVSSDGSSILYGSAKEESNLWKVDIGTGKEESFVSGIEAELWPNYSPKGDKVVFQAVKNLSQGNNLMNGNIVVKPADAEGQPSKIADKGFLPVWSPDGNRIAFLSIAEESVVELNTINAIGGSPLKLASEGIPSIGYSMSPYNRVQTNDFAWAPDSSSIAFVSSKNGYSNIWTVKAEGGNPIRLTGNAANRALLYCPVWSSDGKKLAYYSKESPNEKSGRTRFRFIVYDNESKESVTFHETERQSRLIGWSASGEQLIIASSDTFSSLPPTFDISSVGPGGEITKLMPLARAYYYNVHLAPDNTRISYVANRDGNDDVWIAGLNNGNERRISKNSDANLYFSSLVWSSDGETIFFGKQNRFSLLSIITNFPQRSTP